ncbi:MAG: hypothetical protein H0X34_19350 [Chthoniobacterales bacterium]|nr:hypothetical protein [Chthoniobacterales bacterium]
MSYTTVFDVTQSGYRQWWFAAFGLIFVAVGFALPYLIRIGLLRKPPRWMEVWFRPFFLGFAILWTVVSFAGTASDYFGLAADLRRNRCEVVEGVVEQFDPMPYTGHRDESFVVADHRFHYSDYEVTAGFNQSTSHGGPIRDGLRVRIHCIGNRIAKLEVANSP